MPHTADIRWTTHGVAHITADDWASLGFGQGWAIARDHLPTIADQIVKVRSERARFHGPGPEGSHLATDFGYAALGVTTLATTFRDAQEPWIRELISGYVAGYNQQVAESVGGGSLPAWADGAAWVRPIDELDLYAYLVDVALLGSGRNLAALIGRAEAPGPDGPVPPSPMSAFSSAAGSGQGQPASCGWAFGGDATASGHGIVAANPHFPWGGEGRFWECHLTLPGQLDVYGVCLLGVPGVQMGFNRHIAWAHTFSRGNRFTVAKLDLVPGAPTTYRYGDDTREMEPATHSVECRGDDGSLTTIERTLWSSHHGPMLNLPLLGWGTETGFTYRDANLDNTAVARQFLEMCRAGSLDDLKAAFATVRGMPWVNTLAADATGDVWYIDASATPNLSEGAAKRFRERAETDFLGSLLYESRVALLDGSDPDDEWVEEPGARSPGLIPHTRLPQLTRRDFVANANDAAWVPHATETLEGHSPLHGLDRAPLSLRTRQTMRLGARLCERGGLTVDDVAAGILGNESFSAELLRDAVVERARGVDGLHAAVDVLEAWDGRYDLTSTGAVLWRELVSSFTPAELRDGGPMFAVPFDPADPIGTPRDLAPAASPGRDHIVDALRSAVDALDVAGIKIDAALGDVQWAQRGDRRVPVHGGNEADGVTNILAPTGSLSTLSLEPSPPAPTPVAGRERSGLAEGGYDCTYGTSFVMVVELTPDGPVGKGLLAYGQSGDPRSPHHADGTEAYSTKSLRPLLFEDADVEADPALTRATIREG